MELIPRLGEKEIETFTARVNGISAVYGLALSDAEMKMLLKEHKRSLKEHRRLAFDYEILSQLIAAFCDSRWLTPGTYADALMRLQDLFYAFKNETADRIDDATAVKILKVFFEEGCCGEIEDLETTAIPLFIEAFCCRGKTPAEATAVVLARLKER